MVGTGWLSTLSLRQNGRHFADDIFKCIFLYENVWSSIWISGKFVPKGPINNIPALVQIMAWCRPCDKPLSEPFMVRLPTHVCVTRPQWVLNIFYWQWENSRETISTPLAVGTDYQTVDTNTLMPRQNGHQYFQTIFQMHFLEWNV